MKSASTFAIIGTFLMTIVQLVYTINSFMAGYTTVVFGIEVPSSILNLLYLIGTVSLLSFFLTLSTKQNQN